MSDRLAVPLLIACALACHALKASTRVAVTFPHVIRHCDMSGCSFRSGLKRAVEGKLSWPIGLERQLSLLKLPTKLYPAATASRVKTSGSIATDPTTF